MKKLTPFILAAALIAPAGALHAQAFPSDSAIRAILASRVDSGHARGIVVGLLDRGQRRFVTYGSAGAGRRPLDEHTLFEIGSVSKTFNALLLADAVARGEARLDQPVAELLPTGTAVPSLAGRQITLEHLATHRSGLPRLPLNLRPSNQRDPYADYGAALLYELLADHTLRRAPGDSGEYSNLGAGLLGHALTLRAGAQSWEALVAERVLRPLGMAATMVTISPALATRMSAGHNNMGDTVPLWHFDALAGAGALRSSSADMLTYLAAMLDTTHATLGLSIAAVRTPRASFGGQNRIGLGWIIAPMPRGPVWLHDGGTAGFRSIAIFDPAREVGVVVLSNGWMPVTDIAIHMLDPSRPLSPAPAARRTTVTVTAEQLDRLVGEYPLLPTFVISVTRSGTTLYAQATGQERLELRALSETRFGFAGVPAELEFELGEDGRAVALTLVQGGARQRGVRRE
jgi:serine-type D-Ala-D-Ala carboxypeptidase/endopeptidase